MRWIMDFYQPRAIDPSGGMFQFFLDDGTVYDRSSRHLVSAARFCVTHAMLCRVDRGAALDDDRIGLHHAHNFLRRAFYQHASGAHVWQIDWQAGQARITDASIHAYGMAFVLLAHAHALSCGVLRARADLYAAWAVLNQRFWESGRQLYADCINADGALCTYRGQNANMHACEALIAAYRATGDAAFLERGLTLARTVTVTLAQQADGLIWEHYDADWRADWQFNRDNTSDIFRPWGYQPGHLAEWAKLLVQLESLADEDWLLPRALELFDAAMVLGWDQAHGGMHYGAAIDGTVCYPEKYHWVQAETLAAAALLAQRTGAPLYAEWVERLWRYCWTYFVDHQEGAWRRILDAENRNHTREKSPAGKVDYHNIGACHDILLARGAIKFVARQ